MAHFSIAPNVYCVCMFVSSCARWLSCLSFQLGEGMGNALDAMHGLRCRLQDLEWHLLSVGVIDRSASSMKTPPSPPPMKLHRQADHNSNRHTREYDRRRRNGDDHDDDEDDDDDEEDEERGAGGDLDVCDDYGDADTGDVSGTLDVD